MTWQSDEDVTIQLLKCNAVGTICRPMCQFNTCKKLAVPGTFKCADHRRKDQCTVDGAPCYIQGCNRNERVSGLCNHHATVLPKTKCVHPGCMAQARGSPTCQRHHPDRVKTSTPSSSRGRRANTAAARDHDRAVITAKYNSEGELTPIAVVDDKPLPTTFFEGFQDMLADMVCQKTTFHVPDDNVTVYEDYTL
ncbi:hypothetical protein AC1031_006926 [Aphanomyces cochlioides]|nr:hypothetical protein AC1031_006926 [Aphanomyces cochlioides]